MIRGAPGPCDWINAALDTVAKARPAVLAIICGERGSTPRESGSWILIGQTQSLGSIGGGELERTIIEAGQAMLAGNGDWARSIVHCVLGPDMRQCCGGTLEIMLQPIDASASLWLQKARDKQRTGTQVNVLFNKTHIATPPSVIDHGKPSTVSADAVYILPLADHRPALALFGAGHVGRALCTMASQLPLRLSVFDSRKDQCTQVPASHNIDVHTPYDLLPIAQELRHHDAALVMTHSHALDYELCRILLTNTALRYTGLIGSQAKARRFRKALKKDGLTDTQIARLTSPIGAGAAAGKEPGVIALGVLPEILKTCRVTTGEPGITLQQVEAQRERAAS
ncbi:MAG: xanthine dehydrogenase accessory protein XdhC [Acidiferrobacteraceae bacterium]|nr:xanthine dehydrogenase accessory protein XdhC [Acidiferrobacteraceae bacterium]